MEKLYKTIVCYWSNIYVQNTLLGQLKLKLYKTPEGYVKGDGRCCYLKVGISSLAKRILFLILLKVSFVLSPQISLFLAWICCIGLWYIRRK